MSKKLKNVIIYATSTAFVSANLTTRAGATEGTVSGAWGAAGAPRARKICNGEREREMEGGH